VLRVGTEESHNAVTALLLSRLLLPGFGGVFCVPLADSAAQAFPPSVSVHSRSSPQYTILRTQDETPNPDDGCRNEYPVSRVHVFTRCIAAVRVLM